MSYRPLKGFCLGLASALLCVALVEAAYLRNIPVNVKQPDGTVLSCLASGDEYYNWLHDKDGYTILRNPANGFLVYADKVDGQLVPTEFIAGRTDTRTLEQAGIKFKLLDDPKTGIMRVAAAVDEPIVNVPQTGTINNLVVYIRFSDQEEFSETFVDTVAAFFNSTDGGTSSFRNYFSEVSYNQLTIGSTFYPGSAPGVFSYLDPNARAYYMPYDASTNPEGYDGEGERATREHALLRNAVNSINAAEWPPGGDIDADADGYVDNICFVVKGEPTAWASLLWPHKWALYTQPYAYINGKMVWTYNFQMETSLNVSVLCHEMFHSLGAPDLYHYSSSYSYLQPVWAWDLMEWNLDPPEHMGAYMKWKYGHWIASIPEITASGTYTLHPLTSSTNNCYKIASPVSSTEYFIVEYRKKAGGGTFEGNLYNEGLLVYRINTAYTGNANGPPDEVYIYRPNGAPTVDGEPWYAPFSANQSRTQINDSTNPSSFLTDGSPGGLSISSVGYYGDTISFDVAINTFTLTSPNGGETWVAGSNSTVTWMSTGSMSNVDILLTTDWGTNWTTLVENTPNDGSETITVPIAHSSACFVAVAEATYWVPYDVSDASFSIITNPASVTVTSPIGGETWIAGSNHDITWTQTGLSGSVIVDLYKGGISQKTLGTVEASAGTFSWAIATDENAGPDYRIRVWQGSVWDESDADFDITSAGNRTDFDGNGQGDILWRYYGGGEIQGWNVVWLMEQTEALLPGASIANRADAAKMSDLSGASHALTFKSPLETGKVLSSGMPKILKHPMGIGKAAISKPKKILRNPVASIWGRSLTGKRRIRARDLEALAPPQASANTSATGTGSMDLAALGSSDTVFLPTVQDTLWEPAGTGDFDGNGSTDMLWRYYGSGDQQGLNVIWYMNGTAIDYYGFLPTVQDTYWRIEGTGDFNGDGTLEVLWRYYGTGGFQGWNIIWYMNGTEIGSYGFPSAVTDLNWKGAAVGDFNGDTKADLLWRYYGPGDLQGLNVIWYMDGEGISSYGYPPQVAELNWKVDGAGHFDTDTKADLLWRYYGTDGLQGWTVIWYMNEAEIKAQETLTTVYDINWRIVNR